MNPPAVSEARKRRNRAEMKKLSLTRLQSVMGSRHGAATPCLYHPLQLVFYNFDF